MTEAMRQDQAWHWHKAEGGGYVVRDENRLLVAIVPADDEHAAKAIAQTPESIALAACTINAWNALTGNDIDGAVSGADAIDELKGLVEQAERILKGLR